MRNRLEAAMAFFEQPRTRRLLARPGTMGFSKALQLLHPWAGLTRKVETDLFFGEPLTVVLPEKVSTRIFRYGFFEGPLSRILLGELEPGALFVDVGAHIGYHSKLAHELVGSSGGVVAVEPTPATFELLRGNVGPLENVDTLHGALGGDSGVVRMKNHGVVHSAYNTARGSRTGDDTTTGTYQATVERLDDLLGDFDSDSCFVKLDVEGAEEDVLQGATETLSELRPTVSIEVGDLEVEDAPPSRDVLKMIMKAGYDLFEYGGFETPLQPHELQMEYGYQNIIAIPEERGYATEMVSE